MEWTTIKQRPHKVAIIASGTSLNKEDFSTFQKGHGLVICVNESWRKYPNPDLVVTIDTVKLEPRFKPCPHQAIACVPEDFELKIPNQFGRTLPDHPFMYVKRKQGVGFCEDEDSVNGGENSGFGAMNIAYHMQPALLFLFGIDLVNMGTHCHSHSDRRRQSTKLLKRLPGNFAAAEHQLAERGIEVYNGSPISKLTGWPKMEVREAIDLWNQK